MVSPTINGVALDNVINISSTKDSNIIPITIPGTDSDTTLTFDLVGVTRTYTISGVMIGTSTANLKTKLDNVDALIDGSQTTSYSLITDQTGTKNVKISSFDYTWNLPSNNANYSLRLIEGTD